MACEYSEEELKSDLRCVRKAIKEIIAGERIIERVLADGSWRIQEVTLKDLHAREQLLCDQMPIAENPARYPSRVYRSVHSKGL